MKNLSAKLHVNIVDKKFQRFNDIFFRIFCVNIRVVFNKNMCPDTKEQLFMPKISAFMKEAIVFFFFFFFFFIIIISFNLAFNLPCGIVM